MMEQSNGGVSLGDVKTHALILLFHAQVLQVVHFTCTSLFFWKKKFNFHVKLVTEEVVYNCESLMWIFLV